MTWDQYWHGDPWMVQSFYKADRLRRERVNEEAWLYGAYVSQAIAGTICNAFLDKGSEPMSYPAEPFPIFQSEKKETEVDKIQDDPDALFAMAWMTSMVQVGKNWDKSVVNSDNGN